MSPPPSYHLLEITIISAQDIHPSSGTSTYASAWAHPDQKLTTQHDPTGGPHFTWNQKLLFRLPTSFLKSPTAAVTVDLLQRRRLLRDAHLGTVRILLSALHLSPATSLVALQIRRPRSLRPQGILNFAVKVVGREEDEEEREALESKLEKWRVELSPEREGRRKAVEWFCGGGGRRTEMGR